MPVRLEFRKLPRIAQPGTTAPALRRLRANCSRSQRIKLHSNMIAACQTHPSIRRYRVAWDPKSQHPSDFFQAVGDSHRSDPTRLEILWQLPNPSLANRRRGFQGSLPAPILSQVSRTLEGVTLGEENLFKVNTRGQASCHNVQ